MGMEVVSGGWACTDCIMIIANGDGSGIEDLAGHESRMAGQAAKVPAGWDLVPGGEHADSCTEAVRDAAGCDCESDSFSMSPCDTCGSNLGGARHAVTWLAEMQREAG
jgi:hypothetical protein